MAKRRKFSITDKESVAQRAFGICEYCQMPKDFSTDSSKIVVQPLSALSFRRKPATHKIPNGRTRQLTHYIQRSRNNLFTRFFANNRRYFRRRLFK